MSNPRRVQSAGAGYPQASVEAHLLPQQPSEMEPTVPRVNNKRSIR